MSRIISALAILMLFTNVSFAADGIITLKSQYQLQETLERLEKALDDKGMTVFAKIDHAAGARKVGLDMKPATVVIFGNPKVGTKLMKCSRTVAIDLPQKALIWEDAKGETWYSYNDPQYLVKRHEIKDCEKPAGKIGKALASFARAATGTEVLNGKK